MKKTFRAMITLLLTTTLCTSCKAPDKKEPSDETEKTEELENNEETDSPGAMEVEEETEIDVGPGQDSIGF